MKFCQAGDVYLCDLGETTGSVQSGVRPVVIISSQRNNAFSPIVTVVPMTSKEKNEIITHIVLEKSKYEELDSDSTILGEQVTTVDKRQLIRKLFTLDAKDLVRCIWCVKKNFAF